MSATARLTASSVVLLVRDVVLGSGVRRFDGVAPAGLEVVQTSSLASPLATHITYRVLK